MPPEAVVCWREKRQGVRAFIWWRHEYQSSGKPCTNSISGLRWPLDSPPVTTCSLHNCLVLVGECLAIARVKGTSPHSRSASHTLQLLGCKQALSDAHVKIHVSAALYEGTGRLTFEIELTRC